jgi:hypothetical protein
VTIVAGDIGATKTALALLDKGERGLVSPTLEARP